MAELPDLPVLATLPALRQALAERAAAVLTAPPGSGKTTLVPLALLDAPWLDGRRILMLEPRRLATRHAAARMAALLGQDVGETVGYAMRFEQRRGPATRIEVVTEGLLVRRLQGDPGLVGVGLVVFDEFHERSLDADLGLALTREVQASLRPDLRLLVMSATLDAAATAAYLGGAPVVTAAGRPHPVTIHHRPGEPAAVVVAEALDRHPGDILVFLPGAAEIDRLAGELGHLDAALHRLHGALPRTEQDAALLPAAGGRRKIVLATNIAETSLTIEGVGVVIDTGLARRSRYSPRTGMSRLETVRISRASADQRAGRAGRLGPGHAYRLWPEAETRGLAAVDPPEIVEADLAALVLELALWGVRRPEGLAFMTPPPAGGFAAAQALLQSLGALDEAGLATAHGRTLAGLPLHPRLGHMVVVAEAKGALPTALALAAFAGERDPWPRSVGPDLAARLADWQRAPATLRRLERQLARRLGTGAGAHTGPDPTQAGLCAALAFPDRIAQRRRPGSAELRLANGRGARLADPGAFADTAYLVVWESEDRGSDALVRLAAGLDEATLEAVAGERIRTVAEVRLDPGMRRVVGESRRMLGALVLARRDAAASPEAALACLLQAVHDQGLGILPWSDAVVRLRERLAFLHRAEPGGWPAVDDATLVAEREAWLAPWLLGLTSFDALGPDQLGRALLSRVDPARQADLDRLAPAHWTSPLGSRIAIDYASHPPVLACRLQELFGQTRHPAVLDGRQPLTLHLLSPAGRPIQVTQDLPGFWQGSYAEVRKALRGRYPRHPWPEDPAAASPWRPGLGRRD
jgi:ATP-dependent helicase HrpB